MFRSTPTGLVTREAGLKPAVSLLNNRQRWYGYRQLAAPITQPTSDILPVILREGDEQVQRGDQPEDDNEWA